MRILLIAYEFPPIASAQSLRWKYLSEGLAALGCDVHVLAPYLLTPPNARVEPPEGVRIERCFAGPYVGSANRLGALLRRAGAESIPRQASDRPASATLLAPMDRAYRAGRSLLDAALFPDVRAEWRPFAARRLRKMVASGQYDAVIASHEPATDLVLGLEVAAASGLPLVVDLADPVLAPYTPQRWRSRALQLERRCMGESRLVLVTAGTARDVLEERHRGYCSARIEVLPQAFPVREVAGRHRQRTIGAPLRLLYSGTLYAGWRDPGPLLAAVSHLDAIELVIAGNACGLDPDVISSTRNVRWLGQRPHREILELQYDADVLVNISNADAVQVPGKLYEYIGTGKPILHLASGTQDPGAALLSELGGGMCSTTNVDSIENALRKLQEAAENGTLARWSISTEQARRHSWHARSIELADLLRRTVLEWRAGEEAGA